MNRATLIVNPFASGVTEERLASVERELRRHLELTAVLTERPEHATKLARERERAGAVYVFTRTGLLRRVVVLVAVDALGAAAFIRSANCQRTAVTAESNAMSFQRSAITKMVIHLGVRSFDVGDLF